MNILYWSLDRASIDRAYINSWILPLRMLWVAENISIGLQFALFYTSQIETQIKLFFVRTSKFCFLFGFTFFFHFQPHFALIWKLLFFIFVALIARRYYLIPLIEMCSYTFLYVTCTTCTLYMTCTTGI